MLRLHKISAFVIIILVGRLTANATTFTENAVISHDDVHFEGTDVVVDGCTLIIDGEHIFKSLKVLHGGIITHSAMFTPVLHLIIEEDAYIDAGSCIDASGKGYGPGMGPGKGEDGEYYAGGAGHGGRGDSGRIDEGYKGGLGGTVYGDPKRPASLGSGGGQGAYYSGGAGGGAVRLDVSGVLTVDGALLANGANGDGGGFWSYGWAGGGSGGSIWVTAGTIAGTGQVSADGGHGYGSPSTHAGGGGGGGRVAVDCNEDMFWGSFSAAGGAGETYGGAGSLFIKSANDVHGHLYFDNLDHIGAPTPLARGTYQYDVFTVRRNARVYVFSDAILRTELLEVREAGVMTIKDAADIQTERLAVSSEGVLYLDTPLSVPNVQIEPGGTLTHSAEKGNIDLTVTGDMTVHAGGRVSVDGKGYGPGTGPGAGRAGEYWGSGAGHGGLGGGSDNEYGYGASGSATYGDPNHPASFGSGGGEGLVGYVGGSGGGAICLNVLGVLSIDGAVTANGLDGSGVGYSGGGGSGGSVRLTVLSITGSGQVSADGGAAGGKYSDKAGGGGGGRVAIYAGRNEFYGRVSVDGGDGFEPGEEGSIVRSEYTWDYGDPLHPYPVADLNADCSVDMLGLVVLSSH